MCIITVFPSHYPSVLKGVLRIFKWRAMTKISYIISRKGLPIQHTLSVQTKFNFLQKYKLTTSVYNSDMKRFYKDLFILLFTYSKIILKIII